MNFAGITPEQLLAYESAVMDVQTGVEDGFRAIAAAGNRPTVILCDRGVAARPQASPPLGTVAMVTCASASLSRGACGARPPPVQA